MFDKNDYCHLDLFILYFIIMIYLYIFFFFILELDSPNNTLQVCGQ